jgi:hypothetical protein
MAAKQLDPKSAVDSVVEPVNTTVTVPVATVATTDLTTDQNPRIVDVAKNNMKTLWDRTARVAVPIGAIGGFCGDVLSPLGPVVAELAILTSVLCLVSGCVWFGIKRRQIRLALSDGHIDDQEYARITTSNAWSVAFAFNLVASLVLLILFGAQKVVASPQPDKGAVAAVFPWVAGLQDKLLGLQKTTDRIEATTGRLEAGNEKILNAISGLSGRLDSISKKLETLDKSSVAIERPQTPEENYYNARLYELKGELKLARQAYLEYFKAELPYLDPHLSFSALVRLQDGREGAREAYQYFLLKNPTPSALLARSLLLDRRERLVALENLAKDQPEFAPAYYYLSIDYATPEAGQQTLENLKREHEALVKFRALADRGLFGKFFLDRRIAGNLDTEALARARKFSLMSDQYLDAKAKLTFLQTENGFEGVIVVPYDAAEVFVRMPGRAEFVSTGFSQAISPATGKPLPVTTISLKGVLENGSVSIKYKDNQGVERGPFETEFDPQKEFIAFAKSVLPKEGRELAPVHRWQEKKSITLVQVLMFRAAIAKVSVGPDALHLEKTLRLPASQAPLAIADVKDDDPFISQDVPAKWDKVYLRIDFKDGTQSEPILID